MAERIGRGCRERRDVELQRKLRQVFMVTTSRSDGDGDGNCSQQKRVNYFRFTFLHSSHCPPPTCSPLLLRDSLPTEALSKTPRFHIIYAIFMIIHYE